MDKTEHKELLDFISETKENYATRQIKVNITNVRGFTNMEGGEEFLSDLKNVEGYDLIGVEAHVWLYLKEVKIEVFLMKNL